jgi:lipoate-protein ligase A
MGVDEALLEAAASEGVSTLRFYQWRQPTLSLGYFQLYEERQEHPSSLECPAVRRISGGGAILHDLELTYCLALPDWHPLAVNRLRTYRVVHEALIGALSAWGIEARLVVCEEACKNPATERQPFLCFQRRTRGDVVVGDAKIAGSAQRRCRGAVMQHGSVLLARSSAAPELAGLKEKSNTSINAEDIIQAWLSRLGPALGAQWRHDGLPERYARRAAELMNNKYDSIHWTKNRGRS